MIAASSGDTLLALLILVIIAGIMYGMDYDLRALLAAQADEIGAGEYRDEDGLPGLVPSSGLSATLTTHSSAAGAGTPFDWEDTAA